MPRCQFGKKKLQVEDTVEEINLIGALIRDVVHFVNVSGSKEVRIEFFPVFLKELCHDIFPVI